MSMYYDMKDRIHDSILDALLWLIERVERHKNTGLSDKLHRLADHYDKEPTGEWE